MRHHEQRAREIGEAMRRDGIAAVNYVTGVSAGAPMPDRSVEAHARAQVAIGEFVLAIGGA